MIALFFAGFIGLIWAIAALGLYVMAQCPAMRGGKGQGVRDKGQEVCRDDGRGAA